MWKSIPAASQIHPVGSSPEPLQGFDMQRHLSAISLSLLLPLSACSSSSSEKIMPDFKQNPHPKQAYQLTMTIANAPGPFASVEGFMQFDVSSRECLPPSSENGGHLWPLPTPNVPIVWTQISDAEYTGVVYIDGMIDEDYYGRGVCRWTLIQARADIKAAGSDGETRFMPNIHPDKLKAHQPQTTYLLTRFYPRDAKLENYPEFGQADRSKLDSALSEHEIFTVTLKPTELTP
jgi:hypothetical protein